MFVEILKNMLLNNQGVKEEITSEIKKYLKMNEMKAIEEKLMECNCNST